MKTVQIPLFPLHTVLYPGGPLPLRIFEARYLDMVSTCLKTDTGFGVALISNGREVGEVALTHKLGTVARIIDWHTRHDGLLGISTMGYNRFRIASVKNEKNHLCVAKVEMLAAEPEIELPNKFLPLADVLRRLMEQAGHHYANVPTRYGDSAWVAFRLSELLPLHLTHKQRILEMDDPIRRLEYLYTNLEGLEIF